jgi:hypothetical protein
MDPNKRRQFYMPGVHQLADAQRQAAGLQIFGKVVPIGGAL